MNLLRLAGRQQTRSPPLDRQLDDLHARRDRRVALMLPWQAGAFEIAHRKLP